MVIHKLVLTFCVTRLILALACYAAGAPDPLAENVTLRVMSAVLSGARGNRQSEQGGGLSAALELARAAHPGGDDASESGR